jgi:hypothetical protein
MIRENAVIYHPKTSYPKSSKFFAWQCHGQAYIFCPSENML